jgi:hypothetical protein
MMRLPEVVGRAPRAARGRRSRAAVTVETRAGATQVNGRPFGMASGPRRAGQAGLVDVAESRPGLAAAVQELCVVLDDGEELQAIIRGEAPFTWEVWSRHIHSADSLTAVGKECVLAAVDTIAEYLRPEWLDRFRVWVPKTRSCALTSDFFSN